MILCISPQHTQEALTAMPEPLLYHKFFENSLSSFNNARMKTLLSCSNALISGNKLTLTDIGRNLTCAAHVKHKIKRVDRFLQNTHLHNEKLSIYRALARPIICSVTNTCYRG